MADVRRARGGDRNNRLNRAAFSLGMFVGGGELDHALVEDELLAAALAAGLPEAEARASLASGLRAGQAAPPDEFASQGRRSHPPIRDMTRSVDLAS